MGCTSPTPHNLSRFLDNMAFGAFNTAFQTDNMAQLSINLAIVSDLLAIDHFVIYVDAKITFAWSGFSKIQTSSTLIVWIAT